MIIMCYEMWFDKALQWCAMWCRPEVTRVLLYAPSNLSQGCCTRLTSVSLIPVRRRPNCCHTTPMHWYFSIINTWKKVNVYNVKNKWDPKHQILRHGLARSLTLHLYCRSLPNRTTQCLSNNTSSLFTFSVFTVWSITFHIFILILRNRKFSCLKT